MIQCMWTGNRPRDDLIYWAWFKCQYILYLFETMCCDHINNTNMLLSPMDIDGDPLKEYIILSPISEDNDIFSNVA